MSSTTNHRMFGRFSAAELSPVCTIRHKRTGSIEAHFIAMILCKRYRLRPMRTDR